MLKNMFGDAPPRVVFGVGFDLLRLGGWGCSLVVFGGGFAGLSGGSLL